MTKINKQFMYREPVMSNLSVAVWASIVVSKYQGCNIDNKLNTRGGSLAIQLCVCRTLRCVDTKTGIDTPFLRPFLDINFETLNKI